MYLCEEELEPEDGPHDPNHHKNEAEDYRLAENETLSTLRGGEVVHRLPVDGGARPTQ